MQTITARPRVPGFWKRCSARRGDAARGAPPCPALPSPSLAADAAYLGLSATAIAASGWPLLTDAASETGSAASSTPPLPDATRSTPRPAFILLTLVSFLPLINFAAWLLLAITEGAKPRYWVSAALYGLPLVLVAVGGGDALVLEAAALCAVHFQVERLGLAALDARAARAEEEAAAGEDLGEALRAASAEELAAFDARLGARLARGPRLRTLAAAAGVPRAKSARVAEVTAGLEAAVQEAASTPSEGVEAVREALVEEAQAALERAGNGPRKRGGEVGGM